MAGLLGNFFRVFSSMSKVEQINALTWQERCELNVLLQNWPEDDWDRQMATEGKFDRTIDGSVS
jgi:hypothetical protein